MNHRTTAWRLFSPACIITASVNGHKGFLFHLWLVFATLFPLSSRAVDLWPAFRGVSGHGVLSERQVPVRWGKDEGVVWRTEVSGRGWSSPVVSEQDIYLTAATEREDGESGIQLVLMIFDRMTGAMRNSTVLLELDEDEFPPIHAKNSHASPTPILHGNLVLCHFGHHGIFATDRQGRLVWKNLELKYPPVHGNGGSPIVVDDRVIFTCDGESEPFVVALQAATGKLDWKRPRPVDAERKFSFCTPSVIEVDGQQQVIVPGSDCVMALVPETGEIIWQVAYDGYSVVPKPVYADGLVFLSTGFGATKILAVDPRGTGDVTETHVVWKADRGAPETPSFIAHRGLLYSLSDKGILSVFVTETGEQVYRERLGGNFSASPTLIGENLYCTNEAGTTFVIRAGRQFEKLAENRLDERTLASLAVAGNTILLRTDTALYCFQ